MEPFEIVEHTADVGIVARGATREELFANAARGMLSVLIEPDTVRATETREVRADGPDAAGLLAAFLGELLYLLEVKHFLFREVSIHRLTDMEAAATAAGEPLGPQHELHTEIKAVTHHGLAVERGDSGWRANVLFDI
jgi:SHS2 domain-containing protein